MSRFRIAGLLIAVVIAAVCVAAAPKGFAVRGKARTLQVDGRERSYLVYVPEGFKGPLPVVFVLHGGGNSRGLASKTRQLERYTQMNEIAARDGFIVIFPAAYEGNWNDGRGVDFMPAQKQNIDDVKFIKQVLEEVARQHAVDRRRVFATGVSNGGCMSHRLAAEAADTFVAVAPVIGGMPKPLAPQFKPGKPVSLFVIQGDADPLMPFEGGSVGYSFAKKRGEVLATPAMLEMYVKHNGVSGSPRISMMPDKDKTDGATVQMTVYPPGRNRARVQYYRVKNGGHTWPGKPPYLPEALIGKTCQDFDASEAIWQFFKSCPPRK